MYLSKRLIRISSYVFFIAGFVFLTGCAATGLKPTEMQETLNNIPVNKGRIYFYRTNSMVGMAMQPNISLNGSVVGESKPGGFFFVDVEPGTHEASARTEVTAKAVIPIRDGETRYVRSSINMGIMVGRIELTLIDPVQAKNELGSLSFTGPRTESVASPTNVAPPPPTEERPPRARTVTLDDLDALLPKK